MSLDHDIRPLTDFQQNTPHFLAELKFTGQPLILTIEGKPEIVVQDARSYQRLLELAERLETIEAVRQGIASADRGEGRPLETVFDELETELRSRAKR